MIPLVLQYWKLALVLALVAALGVQSYRLQGAQGRITVFEEREAAQLREQARRDAANLRNMERTNEENAAARERAAVVVVRAKPPARIASRAAPARSDHKATECVRRGDIDIVVAKFAAQHAAGLGDVITEVSRRHAAEATLVAREFETGAAAYRSCRSYTLNVE